MAKKSTPQTEISNLGLKFIRVFSFDLIPKYLFDQVKGRQWSVQRFLDNAPMFAGDPTNLIFVLADKSHLIQGFLWSTVNVFTKNLDCHILSVDKKYWNQGITRATIDFLKNLRTGLKLKKITFRTTRPRAFARYGAKASKSVVMEV